MANYTQAADVLARWRDVERELEAVEPGTPEAELLQSEAAALRQEMRRITATYPDATGKPQLIPGT